MVIALCMHIAGCFTINDLQIRISKSDWLAFISKTKRNHLGVFKVHDIQDKVFQKIAIIITSILNAKKKYDSRPETINGTENSTEK